MDKYKLPDGRDAHILTHEGAEPMKAFTPQEVEEIEVALEERDAAIAALTPQWSDVKDALPEERTRVLAMWEHFENGDQRELVVAGYFKDGWEVGRFGRCTITHWMPLPKATPPASKGEGG